MICLEYLFKLVLTTGGEKMKQVVFVIFVMVAISSVSSVQADTIQTDFLYYVTLFEPELEGSYATYAQSINDAGVIVGSTWCVSLGWEHQRATVFRGGADIDLLNERKHSEAHEVNNNGVIVGQSGSTAHSTIFNSTNPGNYTDLGVGYAGGVNNNGKIVGISSSKAVFWDTNHQMQELGWGNSSYAKSINDLGGIVGGNNIGPQFYDPRIQQTKELSTGGGANCINNQWQIVGHTDFDGKRRATLFDSTGNGNNINLGGGNGEAYSINELGKIVGWSATPGFDHTAMLFDPTGIGNNIDLNTVIDPSYVGPHLRLALDINNNGWIVGVAGQGNSSCGFLLTPVPEPATLSLLAIGGLTLLRRRRR